MKSIEVSDETFVLEYTDLPPFAQTIREGTGCPVFDIVTMTNYVYHAIGE
jgi:hypothetical protein